MSAPRLDADERARALLTQLTLDEKLSLLAGQSFWKTRAVPRVSLAPMRVTDGPRGVSYHSAWRRCTAFPTGIALGASWDPDLAREFGEALARETAAVGAHVVLGPAVNICRTPLNGRTFEYFTEDPELNARLAVACVQGIQSQGVAACIKHYAANNQETKPDQELLAAQRARLAGNLPAGVRGGRARGRRLVGDGGLQRSERRRSLRERRAAERAAAA